MARKKKRVEPVQKELVRKNDDLQEYALVTKALGNRRMMVKLMSAVEVIAVIPGRIRRRNFIKPDDIVLVSLREFQRDRVDILHKYSSQEGKKLYKLGEIPRFFIDNISQAENKENKEEKDEDECVFDFDEI